MLRYYESDTMDPDVGGCYQFVGSLKNAAPPHDHDFYEIFLITGGSTLHRANGRVRELPEGSLVFIRPRDVHSYEKGKEKDCQFINLTFSGKTVEALLRYFDEEFPVEGLLNMEEPPCVMLSAADRTILKMKLEALNMINWNDKILLKLNLRSLISDIFTRHFIYSREENLSSDAPMWLIELKERMQNQKYFSRGTEMMSQLSGKGREHISRSFAKYFSLTPIEYINQLRMNYAANRLASSDGDILEICMDCGFQSLSHFYHVFGRYYGITPAQFRKQYQMKRPF